MTANPTRVRVADAAHRRWTMPRALRAPARAFAEALFTTNEGPPPAERLDWLMDDLDDYLARAGSRAQLIFQSSVAGLEALAPLAIGKLPPLTRLSLADRVHAIETVEQSAAGLSVLASKTRLCFLWYEHPEVRRSVGVDDGCLVQVGVKR